MNLEWTSDPPWQPGPHFWRPNSTAQSVLFLLTVLDGRVMALIPADGDLEVEYVRADSIGGERSGPLSVTPKRVRLTSPRQPVHSDVSLAESGPVQPGAGDAHSAGLSPRKTCW